MDFHILAMVFAVHGFHAFRHTDEAKRQTTMLQQFAYRVFRSEIFAAFPDAFSHHEIGRFSFLCGLDVETMKKSF
ncbi:hypothetical protein D3C72_2448150 [compost metagenome]